MILSRLIRTLRWLAARAVSLPASRLEGLLEQAPILPRLPALGILLSAPGPQDRKQRTARSRPRPRRQT
jgi:hypothetical protein